MEKTKINSKNGVNHEYNFIKILKSLLTLITTKFSDDIIISKKLELAGQVINNTDNHKKIVKVLTPVIYANKDIFSKIDKKINEMSEDEIIMKTLDYAKKNNITDISKDKVKNYYESFFLPFQTKYNKFDESTKKTITKSLKLLSKISSCIIH